MATKFDVIQNGLLDTGQTAPVTFAKPDTYAYLCGIHNSMTGTVVVGP